MSSLVPLDAADPRILALNNAHAVETSLLDAPALARLAAAAYAALATPDAMAFVIAMDQEADYDSPNFLWFRERHRRFVYIDRIVVAEAARGQGSAEALYADVIDQARAHGHEWLVCEVNAVPPNPGSDAFHASLGFAEAGRAELPNGRTVRYLELSLGDQPPPRSFGRRKGKRLTARKSDLVQTLLPRLRVLSEGAPSIDPPAMFPGAREVWLEIGFGGAEHLLWQAQANPEVGLIGCEPFINGVAKALTGIVEHGLSNIRLHDGDAREVLAALPAACLSRAFVLFPDPWPKNDHVQRRIVSVSTLAALARVTRPGAELRLATDIAPYAKAMRTAVATEGSFDSHGKGPADWQQRPADWPQTRYEEKAIAAGRPCQYMRFWRRA
jgi:tRNA (guanine-N7-)-methyltransferase